MNSTPYRQVHLDFHTSEFLPDVAAAFNPEAFAATLADAGMTERLRLHDVGMSLMLPGPVRGVRLEPQGTPLAFEDTGGRIHFQIPNITGHQLVALDGFDDPQ